MSMLAIPPAGEPVSAGGKPLSPVWYRALRELFVRAGGFDAPSNDELREISEDLQQQIDAISAPAGWSSQEVDFGSQPAYSASFSITDSAISVTSRVQVLPLAKPAAGRTADDWLWDGATFAAESHSGHATVYAVFTPGPVVGKRWVQYSIR